MKKQYKLFLCIFILLIVFGTLVSPYLEYYFFPQDMAHRIFTVQSSTKSEVDNQFLWFTFENDDLILSYQPILDGTISEILYLDVNGESHTTALEGFTFTNEMCGGYLVISDPITWDVDGDGQTETVTVCAKADTNEMQGYSYYSNIFGLPSIPLEIVKNGRTGLIVYRNGEVYNGQITLATTGGTEPMEITDGNIDFVDARELWDGVSITIREGDQVYIGTYVPEAHTLFTLQHMEACVPFFVLVGATVLGIALVCMIRGVYRRKHF